MNNLIKQDWYQVLLEDLKKLEYTGIVLTKWNIGKRIIADELKFNKPEYGSKRIENIAKDLGSSKTDLYNCISFYKKCVEEIPTVLENLSWHYISNNYLPEPRPEKTEAEKEEEREVLRKIKEAGKYQIIYADPPWQYYEGGYKNQSQHYPTMSLEDICKLPISDLAADDCLLFMWVTFPMLDQFIDVLRCWGFEYSTVAFTWVKSNKDKTGFFYGLGNWTRSNAEICILARRGSIERVDASIDPPPFLGHGLDERQVDFRMEIFKDTGIRTFLLIRDLKYKKWFWQYLDVLESLPDDKKFITRNKIKLYPLNAFNI